MKQLNHNEVLKVIPQRYPFLMIDYADVADDNMSAIGYKNVSGNEGFFQGHFPGNPIMPGVLILEAMGQTGAVLLSQIPDKLAMFVGFNDVRFRKSVLPGDVLRLSVQITRLGKIGKAKGEAFVKEEKVAEAEFLFALVDK